MNIWRNGRLIKATRVRGRVRADDLTPSPAGNHVFVKKHQVGCRASAFSDPIFRAKAGERMRD